MEIPVDDALCRAREPSPESGLEIPEQQLTVDNPLQTPIVFGSKGTSQRIAFEGQDYEFPADTTDDEMLEFLNNIPAEEEVVDEEPP